MPANYVRGFDQRADYLTATAQLYLSTQQVADRLGITRDVLQHQIRDGDFIAPDVVVGERGIQGWSPARVDEVRLERMGNSVDIDPDKVFAELNHLRAAAETLRAYIRDDDRAEPIHRLPYDLHRLCAAIENSVRDMMTVHEEFLTQIEPERATGQPRRMPVAYQSPDLIIPDPSTNDRLRIHQLSTAVKVLESVIQQIPTIFASKPGREALRKLQNYRSEIATYIDKLKARPGQHDVVRLLQPLPEHSIAAGTEGTVETVHDHSCQRKPPAYEVKFSDSDGATLARAILGPEDVEVTWRWTAV